MGFVYLIGIIVIGAWLIQKLPFGFRQSVSDDMNHQDMLINQLREQQNLDFEQVQQLQQMNQEQFEIYITEQHWMTQQELHNWMTDPHQNPGVDHVVDESFHGIDHGLGITNHHDNDHHLNNHNNFNNF